MRSGAIRCRPGSVLLCAVLVAGVGSACGDDEPDRPEPPTTTAPTTSAPSTTLSSEEEDEQALRQLAAEWYTTTERIYAKEADPGAAEQFVTGDYLADFLDQIQGFLDSGNSIEARPETTHVVENVTVSGDAGTVRECVVDADVLFGPDGEVLNDLTVTKYYETAAIRTEEGWRFSRRVTRSEQEGVTQCDA